MQGIRSRVLSPRPLEPVGAAHLRERRAAGNSHGCDTNRRTSALPVPGNEVAAVVERLWQGFHGYPGEGERAPPPLLAPRVALLRLVQAQPGITEGEARDALRLGFRAMTLHVNWLFIAGLLDRTPRPDPLTERRLYPTPFARRRAAMILERQCEEVHKALQSLSHSEQKAIAEALASLNRLADVLEPVTATPTS